MLSLPPTLQIEFVTNESEFELLSKQLVPVPDHSDVYELPETVCMFPPNIPLKVKAIFHSNIREIALSVSSDGKLLLSVLAAVDTVFEACTSINADSDLRIVLTETATRHGGGS
jgi:hypothetical protein